MAGDTDISSEAVRKATGHGWSHWFGVLDGFGTDLDHTARAAALQDAHPGLGGWWVQMITVQFERERGLRQVGQASRGGFQVSATRTLDMDAAQAWRQLTTRRLFGGPAPTWQEGRQWEADGVRIEVRRVQPERMLRWWWHDADGRSTVEVFLQEKGPRCTVTFRHHGLASQDAREPARSLWKEALDGLQEDDEMKR